MSDIEAIIEQYASRMFATWNLLVSEGHCPNDHCRGRLRTLRGDEISWLIRYAAVCIGRCTECGSFVFLSDDGQVKGYWWSIDAPCLAQNGSPSPAVPSQPAEQRR